MTKVNAKFLPMENRQGPDSNDSSLTPELVNLIAHYYRAGLRDSAVANMVGKSPHTIRDWLVRGAMGSTNALYQELYYKCAKAVGSLETELIAEIRKWAFGSPTEYAYESVTDTNGSVTRRIQLNNDGEPIVIKEEIRGNPNWIAWIMERRFRSEWGNEKNGVPVISTPDVIHNNITHQQKENSVNFGVDLTKEERLEMLELLKTKIRTEGLAKEPGTHD